jgi:cytochrome oxidase Cu insertion factor (SCO1/SenC/PrrC family)
MISQKNKGRLVLIVIALMFFIPILLSWYLSFFSDFKKDAKGIQHGILIEPPIPLGNLQAFSIGETNIDELQKKWTLVFFTGKSCKQDCQNKLYQLRQIRLAVGKDRDKVERLLIADKSLDWEKFKDDYKDQKVIDDRSKSYNSLIKLFKQYEGFDMSSIYLIDAYGSLIMKYQKDAKPKGIIKDIERLIRVAP